MMIVKQIGVNEAGTVDGLEGLTPQQVHAVVNDICRDWYHTLMNHLPGTMSGLGMINIMANIIGRTTAVFADQVLPNDEMKMTFCKEIIGCLHAVTASYLDDLKEAKK